MIDIRYRFKRIRHTGVRKQPCASCGKQVTRQRTFEQTVNPFNKNDDGLQKSRSEVYKSVVAQAVAWSKDHSQPVYHPRCQA